MNCERLAREKQYNRKKIIKSAAIRFVKYRTPSPAMESAFMMTCVPTSACPSSEVHVLLRVRRPATSDDQGSRTPDWLSTVPL